MVLRVLLHNHSAELVAMVLKVSSRDWEEVPLA